MTDTTYGGHSTVPKAFKMLKFPRPVRVIQTRITGHPIRLAGVNGNRLRIKSGPRTNVN